jgi:hypothetical protein
MSEIVQVSREDIVREANSLVDIPFRHQGDEPESGLDCRGVLLAIGKRLGYQPKQVYRKNYRRHPDPIEFRSALEREFDEIAVEELGRGDVALIYIPRHSAATHVGVLADGQSEMMLVHASESAGKVVKEPLRRTYRLIVAGFRFRGLMNG